MAWTTPVTAVVNAVLPAAKWNTEVRDNTNFLFAPPSAKSHKTADIGIATATWSSTALGSSDWDTDGMHNISTAVLTINTAGVYIITGTARFATDGTGTGRREARINLNSGTLIANDEEGSPSTSLPCDLNVTAQQKLSPGDTLVLEVYQSSGGSLNLLGSNVPLGYSLAATWIGNGA